jgi:hypothetical protein
VGRSLRDAYVGFALDLPLVGAEIYPATNGRYTPKAITRHEVAAVREAPRQRIILEEEGRLS